MAYQNTLSYFPSKMGNIFFQAMEEIIGRKGVNAALQSANLYHLVNNYPPYNHDTKIRFDDLSHLQVALEKLYGLRGSQGLALRSGRVCFKYGLREFGHRLGLTETSFRLLPLNEKLRTAANLFARSLDESKDQRVLIEEETNRFLLNIERCPICWGRHSQDPACHLGVGVLQEALYWISGGKYFKVEETNCIAKGDQCCTMVIHKQPLE